MNRTFLRATAFILAGFFIPMTILNEFGVVRLIDQRNWSLFWGLSGMASGYSFSLLRNYPASAETPIRVRPPKHFSLKQLLFQITMISLLLGLSKIWPILAAATAGTYVGRSFIPRESLTLKEIEESILSATLATMMSLAMHVNVPNLGLGGLVVVSLCIVFGAAIGEFLASIFRNVSIIKNNQHHTFRE